MKFLSKFVTSILFVGLASCGGGSSNTASSESGSSTSNTVGTSVQTSARNLLFVADSGSGVLAAFPDLNPVTGTTLSGSVLSSSVVFGSGLAYDAGRDFLYATANYLNDGSRIVPGRSRIVVFDRASELTGKITPSRTIYPTVPGLSSIEGVFFDKERDALYVAVHLSQGGAVAVLNNVSALNGDAAPTRLLTNVPVGNIAVDTKRSILYIEENHMSSGDIVAYHNLDKLDGAIPFSNRKIIWLKQSTNATGLAIDSARDRLYVGEEGRGIRILDQASTAGINNDAATITYTDTILTLLPNVPQSRNAALAFDPSNDRLYAGFGNVVYLLNAVSRLNANSTTANALSTTASTGSIISDFAFPQ